jgi:hypothetical protein
MTIKTAPKKYKYAVRDKLRDTSPKLETEISTHEKDKNNK